MKMSGIAEWTGDYKQSPMADVKDEGNPPTPWPEEFCEELWDRVEGVRHKLTRILNPAKLTPYLRQCKVIDEQDEDEIVNSTQYPLRVSKAGRLLDILRGRGQRGLQAFMESLEFYHPEQFTLLTGKQPTQRCSIILDEEGPEGLTQFLLVEVRKLREQLQGSRLCERRMSQRCRVAEEERSHAERKAQDLRQERLQMERLRQDWEAGNRELSKLKERHLEQAVKYSRALEEQALASLRERELLAQMEKLKNRLIEAENQSSDPPFNSSSLRRHSAVSIVNSTPPPVPDKPLKHVAIQNAASINTQALLEILEQDRREATEQRHEFCDAITRIQGELESSEEIQEKLGTQCEQLQLKVRTLQLDWETEQKRSISYFNQVMELEKERDQALHSRDGLQLELTDCLLDKNRLRKRIAELQANLEQQERELAKERERSLQQMKQSNACLHCSHLSLCSEDQCYGPCCSLGTDLYLSSQSNGIQPLLRKARGSRFNSEENLLTPTEDSEKEINRLSTFPFPPCANSINRRFNTEFDLDSWGSDENDLTGEHSDQNDLSLSDSWCSLTSHLFPPDLVNLPPVAPNKPSPLHTEVEPFSPCQSAPSMPKQSRGSLADDITIVGGNVTGIFVSSVRAGSPAEQCGLTEGSELIELESVLFSGESVLLGQCTGEVAHFSLQWWTEQSSLKHKLNKEAYSKLQAQLSSATFPGPDSFYVRVNLDMDPHGDPPCLGIRCDDIMHVTNTHYDGKYQWRCSLVERCTAKPLQTGSMPNYNRAQQLLLVRLRTMALEQKDFKRKMLCKKESGRIRLVKAVSPSCRGIGSKPQVLYTLSYRQEEHLIPYSMVQPVHVQSKRPVIFSPSILSRGLIERLLQPADSGLDYNTCQPEPTQTLDRGDKKLFLLNSTHPEQALGIRLQSIQEVINQDKHCLLELGLGSVEGMLRHGVYPIVIHIRPKTKKHKTLRKLLPGRGEEGVMMEAVCQAEELQLETLPMLYCTLEPSTWSCTEELLAAIRSAIHNQQRAVAWVEQDRPQ